MKETEILTIYVRHKDCRNTCNIDNLGFSIFLFITLNSIKKNGHRNLRETDNFKQTEKDAQMYVRD